MKTEQVIYDFYHRKIGSIETDTVTGDKKAYDFYHRTLGWYDAKMNVTMDFYHRPIGHGDLLSGLIMEANKN